MSLLLISQAYSISDDEDEAAEASDVQFKTKINEYLENGKNQGKSQKLKGKNKFGPAKRLKPINQNETRKKNAACDATPNLLEQWPFYNCKIVFNCENENGTAAGIKINENAGKLENGGWKKEKKKFVFYEEITSTGLPNSKGTKNESIMTSDKMDEIENENENKIFTSSLLDLLDQMENKISEKTTVENNIVASTPPLTKKRRLENNRRNASVISGKDVNFEVCDKIQQRKKLVPHQCIMCFKQFGKPSHLECHILTHIKEKPLFCKLCNESFAHLSNLNRHKLIHTGEKPFQCLVCSASFIHGYHFKNHQRIHTGEKPYQCTICSKPFADHSNWKKHERSHAKQMPFKCLSCAKTFSRRNTLNSHSKKPCKF